MQFLLGSQLGTKREVLSLLLDKGMVMVHLNARHDGVDVPLRYRSDLHLRLNLSYNFKIEDFEVGDRAVQATLSFGGQPHRCVLPWDAIFAMTSHVEPVSYLWPDDLPPELAEQAAKMATGQPGVLQAAAQAAKQAKAEPGRPKLGVILGGASEAPEAEAEEEGRGEEEGGGEDDPPPSPPEGRRYGHLRVVK